MNAAFSIGLCLTTTVALLWAAPLAAQTPADTARFTAVIRFPVTDTTPLFEHPLDSTLVIRVFRQVDAELRHMGWWVAVMRTPVESGTFFNLLYHSKYWHGPYPTDLYAWHFGKTRFPDERILPVHGYPYELRVRCPGCKTRGQGPDVHFTEGMVEVGWRRLPRPNRDPA
ncbi:MAG: hypothetical protein HKM89_06340 [Gemmatimonadales bacterium]|nr:hypothetical protein [Gemmatimonadales bacterium]